MRIRTLVLLLLLIAVGVAFDKGLWAIPREWNPFSALHIGDPITLVTRIKLERLERDHEGCRMALETLPVGAPDYRPLRDHAPVEGCPLRNVVRVNAGGVAFDQSFMATCPLALAWELFTYHYLQPAARDILGSPVHRVAHLGSFACRNVYGRENGRRSAHAEAAALDVAVFTLADGRRVSVLEDWSDKGASGEFLRRIHAGACRVFPGVLGPDYNAAHDDHFHLGTQGARICE